MLTAAYIISQIFAFMAYVSVVLTYFAKSKNKILFLVSLAETFFLVHYILLNAFVGAIVTLVCVIRNVWFFVYELKGKNNSITSLIVCLFVVVFTSIFFYAGPWDLFGLIPGIVTTWGVWQKNIAIYHYTMICDAVCWIIYNIHFWSLFAIIGESILLIINTITIIIFLIKAHKRKKAMDWIDQKFDTILNDIMEKEGKIIYK